MPSDSLNQHIVSAVLLRRWTEKGWLTAFNRHLGQSRQRSARSEGFVTGLLRTNAGVFEQRWKALEDPMHRVFEAVDRHEALDDPLAVAHLKDFFALHFSRSRTLIEVFERSWQHSLRKLPHDPALLDPIKLDEYFEDLTGLHPAGPGARLHVLETIYGAVEEQVGPGSSFFGERLDVNFDEIRDRLESWGIQIGVAAPGTEFIIGDDPVQTADSETGRVGILSGVNLAIADTLLMPIGPSHTLAVSKANEWFDVPPQGVRRLNRVQLIASHEKVYFRPSDQMEMEVRSIRDELLIELRDQRDSTNRAEARGADQGRDALPGL